MASAHPEIELIAGETAVDMADGRRPLSVLAGAARTVAQAARLEVRRLADGVCVRCLAGSVQVIHAAGTVVLDERRQVIYDANGLGDIVSIDLAQVSAWREGFLRFTDAPLGAVLEEINRYRPGRVVLMEESMAARPVTGRFRIDALEVAIVQIRQSFGLHARALPGGVLLLS